MAIHCSERGRLLEAIRARHAHVFEALLMRRQDDIEALTQQHATALKEEVRVGRLTRVTCIHLLSAATEVYRRLLTALDCRACMQVDAASKRGKFALLFQRGAAHELLQRAKHSSVQAASEDGRSAGELAADLEQAHSKSIILHNQLIEAKLKLREALQKLEANEGMEWRGALHVIRHLSEEHQAMVASTLIKEDFGRIRPLSNSSATDAATDVYILLDALPPGGRHEVLANIITEHVPRKDRPECLHAVLTALDPIDLTACIAAHFRPPADSAGIGAAEYEHAAEGRFELASAVLDALGGSELPSGAPELFRAIEERLGALLGTAGGASTVETEEMRVEMAKLSTSLEKRTAELDEQTSVTLDALDGFDSVEELVVTSKSEAVEEALEADGRAELLNQLAESERRLREGELRMSQERKEAASFLDECGIELGSKGHSVEANMLKKYAEQLLQKEGTALPEHTGKAKHSALALSSAVSRALRQQLVQVNRTVAEQAKQIEALKRIVEENGRRPSEKQVPSLAFGSRIQSSKSQVSADGSEPSSTDPSPALRRASAGAPAADGRPNLSTFAGGSGGASKRMVRLDSGAMPAGTPGNARGQPSTKQLVRNATKRITQRSGVGDEDEDDDDEKVGGVEEGDEEGDDEGDEEGSPSSSSKPPRRACHDDEDDEDAEDEDDDDDAPALKPPRKYSAYPGFDDDDARDAATPTSLVGTFGGVELTTAGVSPMSAHFLYRMASQFAQGKIQADASMLTKGKEPQRLDDFIVEQLTQQYGMRDLAQTYLCEMFKGLSRHRADSTRLRMFAASTGLFPEEATLEGPQQGVVLEAVESIAQAMDAERALSQCRRDQLFLRWGDVNELFVPLTYVLRGLDGALQHEHPELRDALLPKLMASAESMMLPDVKACEAYAKARRLRPCVLGKKLAKKFVVLDEVLDELAKAHAAFLSERKDKAGRLFKKFDTNGDGCAARPNVARALSAS